MARELATAKRREFNKKINREEFRDKLNFTKTFNTIARIEDQLMAMCVPQVVFTPNGDMQMVLISPDTAVVATLKVVLDSNWKRMDKVMPNLKPIDQHALLGLEIEEDEDLPMMDMVEFKKRLRHKLFSDRVRASVPDDAPEVLKGTLVDDEDVPEWMN